ncbi:unnamed protein product [Ambrosiozyma monospora]|uniref:Unnamed protein product n=1 Tax=Ambrosiozyma monospora TaxID=43982 RepID=A0ACB5U967_AMBMO|nr:unnamed protein product [Ambrosiozyma monospora]
MGAFKAVEKQLITDDSPLLLDGCENSSTMSNGAGMNGGASKIAKNIVAQPTTEAYYRVGAMISNSPVPLHAFEKFLLEADVPLRNNRLDASTSLAVEQQIVCQGYVSKSFFEHLKSLFMMNQKIVCP